jgi:hypothetical protein
MINKGKNDKPPRKRSLSPYPYSYTLEERLSTLFDINYETGCWEWTGCLYPTGYGRLGYQGKIHQAHRLVWEAFVGIIPTGLVLDHLCCNHKCVNPDHLEVVTSRENILRGNGIGVRYSRETHCKRGHEKTPENTYIYTSASGKKHTRCKACHCSYHLRKKIKLDQSTDVHIRIDWSRITP